MAGPRSADDSRDPRSTVIVRAGGRSSKRRRLDYKTGVTAYWVPRLRGARQQGSLHRRVHQIPQHGADVLALARALHHEHREQVLLRIDPEERSGHAAPEEVA